MFTPEEFKELSDADYKVNQVAYLLEHRVYNPQYPYAVIFGFDKNDPKYLQVVNEVLPIYQKYGAKLSFTDPLTFQETIFTPGKSLFEIYRTGLGIPSDPNLRFDLHLNPIFSATDRSYIGEAFLQQIPTVEDYQKRVLGAYYIKPDSDSWSIWDSIFQGPFDPVKFLNPISGGKQLYENFTSSPETIADDFSGLIVSPPPVNYAAKGLEAGVNVVSSIGIAYGVNSIQTGVTSLTTLPQGVEGPVVPGFWDNVLAGNFKAAWQIISLETGTSIATASAQTGFAKTAELTAFGQAFREVYSAFGQAGRGVLDILTGNFEAGFSKLLDPNPTFPRQNPVGYPSNGGGLGFSSFAGRGAGGYYAGGGYNYPSTGSLITPASAAVIGIVFVVLIMFIVLRKGR